MSLIRKNFLSINTKLNKKIDLKKYLKNNFRKKLRYRNRFYFSIVYYFSPALFWYGIARPIFRFVLFFIAF